jgi:hypothetical protein
VARALAVEDGADQAADEQVVAGGDEDGGEDDERLGDGEGRLFGVKGKGWLVCLVGGLSWWGM